MFGDIFSIKYDKSRHIIEAYQSVKKHLKIFEIERIHLFYNSTELYYADLKDLKDQDLIDLFVSDKYREKCIISEDSTSKGETFNKCIFDWFQEDWNTANSVSLNIYITMNKDKNLFQLSDYYNRDKWFSNLREALSHYKDEYNKNKHKTKHNTNGLTDNIIENILHLWNIHHTLTDFQISQDRLLTGRYRLDNGS